VLERDGSVSLVTWAFNAWAKYPNFERDERIGDAIARIAGLSRIEPKRPDTGERVVLEGGGIESDGEGTLLVTEEWLLSDVQVRNPGLDRDGYERVFRDALGIRQTIWLGQGCVGDDTHGHVDDIARFTAPGIVVLAYEPDPADENHQPSADNYDRLMLAGGEAGALRVVKLPYPRPVMMNGERLPASYANFYVANGIVLVPTFNDANDRVALTALAELFPGREVVGIHAVDLVWGLGTLHCLTQQQPAPRPST
jgi:agmatine deiminase